MQTKDDAKRRNKPPFLAKEIGMADFLGFKKMITPIIIKVLFWVGVALSILAGLVFIVGGAAANIVGGTAVRHQDSGAMVLVGLLCILLGPVVCRIYCEILIIVFSIHDTLTEIKDLLKNRGL
jgi:hypothetical protein